MQTPILAEFFERDLRKYIEEIKLFTSETNLWSVLPGITNSAGNLILHITGGLNYHIGATLGQTGYVRNRDAEFAEKNIPKEKLLSGLDELVITISKTLGNLTDGEMQKPFPKLFDKEGSTIAYVLTQLLVHTNYHLGQVNYLRRMLEGDTLSK